MEGDGYIYVPTAALCADKEQEKKYSYPNRTLAFDEDDLPSIDRLRETLGQGHILEVKGANAYRFYIKGNKNLINFIPLINGNLSAAEFYTFHKLLSWFNDRYNTKLSELS